MKRFWIINLVLFQLSWLSAAFFTQSAGADILLFLIIHFALSPTRQDDFKIMLLTPVGWLVDKVQLQLGLFSAGESFFPIWLLLLWFMFILTLNHSLSWLQSCSLKLQILLGAIGGASSYWGGIEAGALSTVSPTNTTLFSLALVWALLLPTLIQLRRRLMLTQPTEWMR